MDGNEFYPPSGRLVTDTGCIAAKKRVSFLVPTPWRLPGAPKKYPLKDLANFSRVIESYNIKFYIPVLVTHSIIRKCGEFHYIIYRIDKIALLLVMAI